MSSLKQQGCSLPQTRLYLQTATGIPMRCFSIKFYRDPPQIRVVKSSSRRKFRSQTSDNKDKWSRGGQSQRRERVRREESECQKRRSKSEKRKSEKCGAIWQDETWTIARRCGAKRIGKSKCQQDVSICQLRATFGSWDVEKVHSAVAWSTLQNQHWKNSSAYSFGSLLPVEL